MFNNIINNVKTKITTIKEENDNYNNLLNNSSKFTNLSPLPNIPQEINEWKINNIQNICPDLTKNLTIIISNIIPINETYLTIIYLKEIITNINYCLIPTNKNIWIINNTSYKIIPYQDINTCTIIKNNIMSKIINLNNIILEAIGNDNKINTLINILTNQTIRNNIIAEKTSYLCNIVPIYQKINTNNSGISIDNNNNIVFHTKTFNYKYSKNNITNYELLIDNNPIIIKNQNSNTHLTSMQNNCYTIDIKITTLDKSFIIPILEPNNMGKKYNYTDKIYQDNINFAKEIINKLNKI